MGYNDSQENSGGGDGAALVFGGMAGGLLGYASGYQKGQRDGYWQGHADGKGEGMTTGWNEAIERMQMQRDRTQAHYDSGIRTLNEEIGRLSGDLRAKEDLLREASQRLAEAELALAMHRAELPDEEDGEEEDTVAS